MNRVRRTVTIVALAVAIGVATTLLVTRSGVPQTKVAAARSTSTVPPTAVSVMPATTSSSTPADLASTTVLTTPPTTRRLTTTTAVTSPPTTARVDPEPEPVTSSTTTTVDDFGGPRPGPACEPSMFEGRLTFDKPSYRVGEVVTATATFTNVSGETCWWASSSGGVDVYDASGRLVTVAGRFIADNFRWTPFEHGGSHSDPHIWDQKICSEVCTPAPPGTYRMEASEHPFGALSGTFQVVP